MQEIGVSQASLEQTRGELMKKYGLDVPIFAQYGRWIGVCPLIQNGRFPRAASTSA